MAGASSSDIRPSQLNSFFVKATAAGTLCGADVLKQLSKHAAQCCSIGGDAQRAVAFALESFADQYAHFNDRQIQIDECQRFLALVHQPISDAVTFIMSGGNAATAVRIIAALSALAPQRTTPT